MDKGKQKQQEVEYFQDQKNQLFKFQVYYSLICLFEYPTVKLIGS